MQTKKPSRAATKAAKALLAPSPELLALQKQVKKNGRKIEELELTLNTLLVRLAPKAFL